MDLDRRALLTAVMGSMALFGSDEAADAAAQSEPPDPSVYIKLFQERPEPDKAAALPKLDVYRERSLRAFTEHFYQTAPK